MAGGVCVLLLLCVCVCECVCVRDYYAVLGVPRSATDAQVKRAFHKLALKHHPDRDPSPDAQHTFTHIAQAYEVLSDRERRRQYDRRGGAGGEGDGFCGDSSCYGDGGFLRFSLDELLQMEEEIDLGEGPDTEGWKFPVGGEESMMDGWSFPMGGEESETDGWSFLLRGEEDEDDKD